jgi:hypothetical protein
MIVVAGISRTTICPVREVAVALEKEIGDAAAVRHVWFDADHGRSPRPWLREVGAAIDSGPDVIVVHYSVFAFGWRGIPLLAPLLAQRLRRGRAGVVLYAHELAFPFRRRGVRGVVHAVSQRAVLPGLVRASDAIVVTTSARAVWLRSAWWLPGRPIFTAPVFSLVPVGDTAHEAAVVGIFGYGGWGDAPADIVLGAARDALECIDGARIEMIGLPGTSGSIARQWIDAAERVGCTLSFTGPLEPDELSAAIGSCTVMISADPEGPSSRKTSLAAVLALGKATIVLPGTEAWPELVASGAVRVVAPDRSDLAVALRELVTDASARSSLAESAQQFYGRHMGPDHARSALLGAVDAALDRRSRGRR